MHMILRKDCENVPWNYNSDSNEISSPQKFRLILAKSKKFREGGPTPSLDLLQKPKYLGFRRNLEWPKLGI